MSSHADTIRRVLDWPIAYFNEEQEHEARLALDAMEAENQRHRDALELIAALPRTLDVSGPRIARAALDGTPSAAE